jgi:23S rRNA pseudouridine1911/1915/1917 synthase
MSTPRTVEQATPLLEWLFATWPEAKRNTVRGWLKNRQVMVNGRVVSQFDHALRPDDAVTIGSQPQTAPGTRLPGGILIRYEDDALLVVEKPTRNSPSMCAGAIRAVARGSGSFIGWTRRRRA